MTETPSKAVSRSLESFWELRELFKTQMQLEFSLGAGEDVDAYGASSALTPLNERLIQAIWANQLLRSEGLRLLDGRSIRVLDQGRWNSSAGPDFLGARLMIDARELSGDVEIHLLASHWRAHRHEADLDYNNVIVHVVYQSDDGRDADTLHNGETLPRLELEPYLFPDLETIRLSLTPDDYPYDRPSSLGKCYELMTSMDEAVVARFLDRGGDERLSAKVQRLEDQARTADPEQVLYQALMLSLGSGPGKSLYYLLAKRAPLGRLYDDAAEFESGERRLVIESILFHIAGLAPEPSEIDAAPEESLAYLRRLEAAWERVKPYWSDRLMTPTRRWFQGIRPVNFPTRRLAAIAGLIARSVETRRLPLEDIGQRVRAHTASLEKAKATRRLHPAIRDLTGWFTEGESDSFWSDHYSFNARRASRTMVLIGDMTARSLVFNAVLPALALLGRRDKDEALTRAVRRLYSIFPPLQANHITRFMERRLFGDSGRAKALITTERRRQGLFQIFYSCCNGEVRNCESCYYFAKE